MNSTPKLTEEEMKEEAEKQKIIEEHRQSLYQIRTSILPDPLTMELLLSHDDNKLLSRHKITKELANQLRSDLGLKHKITPKLARIVINLMYEFTTNDILARISNQLTEFLKIESQNMMMMQKLTVDINQIKNELKPNESKVEEKKTAKKKKSKKKKE